MTIAILLALIALSAFALLARDLLHAAIALSATSLLTALLFYLAHSPDVAITEAAVGAGISTVVLVWLIKSTSRKDES
jgi:energy-converting hydrogenase B subunit D